MREGSNSAVNNAKEAASAPASLMVFADDWGRHPSSCQHLVRQLLDRWPVCWVNTIGTQAPRFNWSTMRRGLEKLAHWTRRAEAAPSLPNNLTVVSPIMWPWFRRRHDRWLNRRLLIGKLSQIARNMPQPVAAVTTLPITDDLVGALPIQSWVYYCVDDFSAWPGMDRDTMDAMERELVAKVDGIIAVSEHLRGRIASRGREAALLTHGVDLEHWRQSTDATLPKDLVDLPRPWITFWGLIDRRMDVAFVERLSRDLTEGTILLVGPTDSPDPRLLGLPKVVRASAVDYADLPAIARASSVLIMPYADAEVTRAMQPLKLKEYMATGLPVVVRGLPSTRPWSDCVDVAASAEEFSALVGARLDSGLPQVQADARRRLDREGWAAKAEEFADLIRGASATLQCGTVAHAFAAT